jgi:heavy metal translocating P-type ATPase
MVARIASTVRRSPMLAVLLGAGIVALSLWAAGLPVVASWVAGGIAAFVGLLQVVQLIREFRQGRWGLDVLAILAIAATLWLGDAPAAYVVAGMVVGGTAIEQAAAARAQRTLASLLSRVPRVAHVTGPGGVTDVPVEEVRIGDTLRVKVGEPVPVDAILLDDEADLDQSSLTGESLPVAIVRDAGIASGSIVAGRAITVRAAAVAAESQYQRIVAMVADAAGTKGRFIRLADRIAIPFTLTALAIAALAWLISGDPVRFAEVLVVATPCPLLVAAPTALMAGMDRAARDGVVVKGGDAFERLAVARTVLFDKTGTLTRGEPELVRIESMPSWDQETVLSIARAAEEHSTHVLAEAIVRGAEQRGIRAAVLDDVRETIGQGIAARWNGRLVKLGRQEFSGGDPQPLPAGEVAVHLSIDDRPAARLVLRDELRPDASEAVLRLRALGLSRIAVVTGDGEANARRVAEDAGITEVHAGMRPEGKVAVAATATRTVMVGDGVNDAPVLAAADVGIAIGSRGASAASETADVVLLTPELVRIPQAIRTARNTMRIARQSVIAGVVVSLALMIVASTGVIPALAGALAQEAVDIVTILNGLRAARASRDLVPFASPRRPGSVRV